MNRAERGKSFRRHISIQKYRSAHHCTSMLKERRRDYGLRETRGTVSPLDRCPKTKTDYWLILYLPDLWYSPNCTTRWIPFPPSDNWSRFPLGQSPLHQLPDPGPPWVSPQTESQVIGHIHDIRKLARSGNCLTVHWARTRRVKAPFWFFPRQWKLYTIRGPAAVSGMQIKTGLKFNYMDKELQEIRKGKRQNRVQQKLSRA